MTGRDTSLDERRGIHLLTAQFAGSDAVRGSTTLVPIPVIVF